MLERRALAGDARLEGPEMRRKAFELAELYEQRLERPYEAVDTLEKYVASIEEEKGAEGAAVARGSHRRKPAPATRRWRACSARSAWRRRRPRPCNASSSWPATARRRARRAATWPRSTSASWPCRRRPSRSTRPSWRRHPRTRWPWRRSIACTPRAATSRHWPTCSIVASGLPRAPSNRISSGGARACSRRSSAIPTGRRPACAASARMRCPTRRPPRPCCATCVALVCPTRPCAFSSSALSRYAPRTAIPRSSRPSTWKRHSSRPTISTIRRAPSMPSNRRWPSPRTCRGHCPRWRAST